MNIVLINDTGIETFKSWSDVKKYSSFTKDDFTKVGVDYVLNCNNETYEISKDIKTLERVASERVFAKSQTTTLDWLIIATFILTLYNLIS